MSHYKNSAVDLPITDHSITERVFANLVKRPDEVVLVDGPTKRSMTAADFIDQVKRLAGGLTSKGFGKDSVVGLMAPNSPEYCVVFHAVAWAGGTVTTINPTYTSSEVNHQLNDSGAELLIDNDGYMFVVDRLKELIKYKGFQVAPAELEATLVAHPGISDAAVIGIPDPEAGELPMAFVVTADPAPTVDEIKAYLMESLSSYKQVHKVEFVDEIPKSASGKILRRVLRDQMA